MAQLKVFTKCNGEVVELTRTGYDSDPKWTKYEGQGRFVRTVVARGPGYVKYSYLGGTCPCGNQHFAERQIERPAHSSNHKCDGRCVSAKGGKCECACGGKNHGSN